jgi:type I restriction enzyme S subunit
MSKAKNIPALRFPEFGGEWKRKKLDDISAWASGGTPSKNNESYWNGNIPWISASSMRGLRYSDSESKITPLGLKNGSKLASSGSILILVRGSMLFNKIPIGIAAKDVAFNQDVKSIVINGHSTAEYILHWFIHLEPKILSMVTGTGIGAGKLDLADLKALGISLPSIFEQKKIASFLTAIDEKLQALKKKKVLLEQYKKGVMQKIFSQELRFKDENGNNFADWEVKKLGDTLLIIVDNRGKTPPTLDFGVPLLEVNSIGGKNINYRTVTKFVDENTYSKWFRKFLEKGDVLFSTVGNTALCSFYDGKIKANIAQNIVGLRFEKEDGLFMFYLLTEKKNNNKFKQIEMGAVQPSIKVSQMIDLHFDFPSIREQQKIANFLTAIDEKISQQQSQIDKVLHYKKGLLQQMFC